MTDKKLTVRELAEMLQITQQAVQKWARENQIPHYRVGVGKVMDFRFDKEEILEFFRAKKTKLHFEDIQ